MNPSIRSFLIELARKRTNQTISYTELCQKLNLRYDMSLNPNDRVLLRNELEQISKYEFEKKRPLLSSLVIRKSDFEEGNGFYEMCEHLGFGNKNKLKKDVEFQARVMKNTMDFWQDEDNYIKFK